MDKTIVVWIGLKTNFVKLTGAHMPYSRNRGSLTSCLKRLPVDGDPKGFGFGYNNLDDFPNKSLT